MKHTSLPATPGLSRQYEQLRQRLSQIGYLSQGSVQDRTGRVGGGAGYQWTRKVAQKTVTVALTQEQFELLQQATHNYQLVRRLLHQMETLSRKIIKAYALYTICYFTRRFRAGCYSAPAALVSLVPANA